MHGTATLASLIASRLVVSLLVLFSWCGGVDGAFYSSQRKAELREMAAETWRHAYNSYKRAPFRCVRLNDPRSLLPPPRQVSPFPPTSCFPSPAASRAMTDRTRTTGPSTMSWATMP